MDSHEYKDYLNVETPQSDIHKILKKVFEQIVDDYIKLAHPIMRQEKYLYEYYLMAVAALFDDTYEFATIPSLEDIREGMTLREMLSLMLEVDTITDQHLNKLRNWVAEQTVKFWRKKHLMKRPVLYIPDTVSIRGYVFDVSHRENLKVPYEVNIETYTICLNKQSKHSTKNFLEAVLFTIALLEDMRIPIKTLKDLTAYLWDTLKVNDFLRPSVVPKVQELNFDKEEEW